MIPGLLVLAAVTPPPDDRTSPGLAGFLAIFLLALATVVLIRSMVKHLRKVQYSPDPAAGPEPGRPAPDGRQRAAGPGDEQAGPDVPRPPNA